jgi:hypothetical protein
MSAEDGYYPNICYVIRCLQRRIIAPVVMVEASKTP